MQAGLTLATTHHAELKAAAEQDARFINVAMQFDVATLSPTYRLMWGAAGASNALAIAQVRFGVRAPGEGGSGEGGGAGGGGRRCRGKRRIARALQPISHASSLKHALARST